jgi:hypothetical protein
VLFNTLLKIPLASLTKGRMLGACSYRLAIDPAAMALLPLRPTHTDHKSRYIGAPIGLADRLLINDSDIGDDEKGPQILAVRR